LNQEDFEEPNSERKKSRKEKVVKVHLKTAGYRSQQKVCGDVARIITKKVFQQNLAKTESSIFTTTPTRADSIKRQNYKAPQLYQKTSSSG
jgi:hypothetical protein